MHLQRNMMIMVIESPAAVHLMDQYKTSPPHWWRQQLSSSFATEMFYEWIHLILAYFRWVSKMGYIISFKVICRIKRVGLIARCWIIRCLRTISHSPLQKNRYIFWIRLDCCYSSFFFFFFFNTKSTSAGADTRTNSRSSPRLNLSRRSSNTFPEEEEPRCSLMPFKLLRMRSGEQTGLALTQLSFFILPGLACLLLQFTGLWKHTLLIFVFPFPPVKQRLGNEWGPFPQRGSGNVKTDFPLTPLEVTGCIILLCF